MGKVIKQKYSDVSHRIIKKLSKKDKSVKESSNLLPAKRKLPPIDSSDEPETKVIKTDNLAIQQTSNVDLSEVSVQNQNEISYSEVYALQISDSVQLDIKENKSKDLFLHDELSECYENYTKNDFGFQILDEISLEGLDGITIEAFWKRLSLGLQKLTNINGDLKESIWRFIRNKKGIQFYTLQEPRGVLDIYDRSKYLDSEIGVIVELAYKLPDIYPFQLVNHPDVQGSCSTFHTRENISSEILKDLTSTEKEYGTRLVMVADQKMRTKALLCESSDPTTELVNMEYCMLERIGRSRRYGELTQGNMSISSFLKMDSKSVFPYKKHLVQYNLLGKQFFYIKSAVIDQNKAGKLLHLKRFYNKIKTKQMIIAEQIINAMKEKPDCRIDVSELRKILVEFAPHLPKIIKSQEFRKYVKVELVHYRDMYPNAERSEYMRKAKPVEKFVKCMELINPHVNVIATWGAEQDDSDEENEEAEEASGGKIYNMEAFKEVFFYILSKGREGSTLHHIQKLMGVDNNTIRMCLKKLLGSNVVTVKKSDQGRQRHFIYYASCVESEDIKMNIHPEPPKLPNNVLAKFKEKQRAAIEKSNQPAACAAETSIKSKEFKWKYEVKVPNLTCTFFISNVQQLLCHKHETWIGTEFSRLERIYPIRLNTRFPKAEQSFRINKLLNEIGSDIATNVVNVNFDSGSVYIAKRNVNYMTKLILLKAAFGDATINANTLNCFARKRQFPTVPVLFDNDKERFAVRRDKLQYMGAEPVTVYREKEGDVLVEIVVSTPPSEFIDATTYPPTRELSERVMTRIHIILRMVHKRKIVEEIFRVIKIIEDEELKDGYTKKIDRKSLARILKRLVSEGYIKIFKLSICDATLTKTQTFVCHPSVGYDNSLIQSACQQLKWKYFVGTQKKTAKSNAPTIIQKCLEERYQNTNSPFRQSDVMNSVLQLKELTKLKHKGVTLTPNRQAGRGYGFKPKFVRMRVIHEFLYYLIYGYDRGRQPLPEREVRELFESYSINVTEDELRRIPDVYCKEISWNMFIPPLPHHGGWMNGWALMCDVILRLPISVLCKIHNVSFVIPELEEVLNHPIKRFYLVKDLPESVTVGVLSKRKYLFDIHESICRLAWCGLVQFGPQKYKEKDQIFVYLNRMASLFDTTSSEPAYNKITNKEYKRMAFVFNSQADIDSYWYNVYGICLNTKLNLKQGGQLVTIFDPQSRPQLAKTLQSKTLEEAAQDDNGEIPGDRRGASGFDSSLWSHISKNWFWAAQKAAPGDKPLVGMGLRKEKLDKVLPKNLSFSELHTVGQVNKVYLHKAPKAAEKEPRRKLRKYVRVPLKPSKRMKKIIRRIPYRQKTSKRQYNDYLDKIILKKIGTKTRAKWSQKEDRALLLCQAACIFLNPRFPKKQSVPYTVVRDVLHRVCPEARYKTSRACQRRMKNCLILRYSYIEDNVSNLLELKPISDHYSCLISHLMSGKGKDNKPVKYSEVQISTAFIILMSYIMRHQEEVESILQGYSLNVDHLTEDRLEFTEANSIPLEETTQKYKDAEDETGIKRDVLKSVIHSSLGCISRQGWSFQLFKIYQKYPDNMICDALTELKQTQMIAFNRFVTRKKKNRWHTPFQLSNLYVYAQSSTFNLTTSMEAYKTFSDLKENRQLINFSQETIESKKYGQLLGLNELCTFWQPIRFKFYLPRTMVILNPHISDHGELIDELAIRWQAKLKRLVQDNTEADLEPDNENDNRSKSHDTEAPGSLKEEASTSEVDNSESSRQVHSFNDNNQTNPLDLTVEAGDSETIDRLKTWVTDCMEAERERRSPSPEFMNVDESSAKEETPKVEVKDDTEDHSQGYDEVDRLNFYHLRKTLTKEQIPTLEEIKEGMLRYMSSEEDRLIPHITDLSSLLNRDYAEANPDEEKLERLKNHFITQYAILEDVELDKLEELQGYFMVEYIQSALRNRKLWEKITSKLVIKKSKSMSEVYEALRDQSGTQSDFDLTDEIVNFVFGKKCLGVTGPQIREHFRHSEQNCPLELIVQTLVDEGILLRTGICTLTFVHHLHASPWLVETFTLSSEEQKFLEEKASSHSNVKKNIEKQLEEKIMINVPVMPWVKVDGTLSEETFKSSLCSVLSYCLENPKVTFAKLCEKFCYIKPVDIYYLVEVLKEAGCVELFAYEENSQNLFSCWEHIKERDATFLDRFENMYVTPNNVSMTCMGSFFQENGSV